VTSNTEASSRSSSDCSAAAQGSSKSSANPACVWQYKEKRLPCAHVENGTCKCYCNISNTCTGTSLSCAKPFFQASVASNATDSSTNGGSSSADAKPTFGQASGNDKSQAQGSSTGSGSDSALSQAQSILDQVESSVQSQDSSSNQGDFGLLSGSFSRPDIQVTASSNNSESCSTVDPFQIDSVRFSFLETAVGLVYLQICRTS